MSRVTRSPRPAHSGHSGIALALRWACVGALGLAVIGCHRAPAGDPTPAILGGGPSLSDRGRVRRVVAPRPVPRVVAPRALPGAPRARRPGRVAPKDIFGYGDAFARALKKIGLITPDQFARRHRSRARHLRRFPWDPTTARFYRKFNAPGSPFRLDARERALFKKNGFVVTGRLKAHSFAEMYYRIYTRDLPVLITTDSVLHAWHRSYDGVLEELEQTYLSQSLAEILGGMAASTKAAHAAYGRTALGSSLQDADYFLAVARSLLAGKQVASVLGSDRRVKQTLAAVKGERLQRFRLFGAHRVVDFSQFKVRGHYTNTALLKRYFRAMMWLGRIDLRVVGERREATLRQLGSAVVLHDLLVRAGRFKQWSQLDRLLQTFVGVSDSMTFGQLGALLAAARVRSPRQVASLAALGRLQRRIARTQLGAQQIRSHFVRSSPFGADKATLPRSFAVMGQKFTVDSWATSKLVADDIRWKRLKVQRRLPSALDVGFAVLGNDHAVDHLVRRMKTRKGRRFRDGLHYQHNLSAVRAVMDAHPQKAWSQNLYLHWLATLRALSAPTTHRRFPEAMRTRAYAMKTLNTQLASWTQLRHDTILYVKQSYTAGVTCYYPAGLVEPRIRFWKRLGAMAAAAAGLIRSTPYPNRTINGVSLPALQKRHAKFFAAFASQVRLLERVATRQLANQKLTAAERKVLKDVVQIHRGSGFTWYNGWYPGLFYKGRHDSGKADPLVADVHTDVPAPQLGDPGGVLHQGVGYVDLMMMASRTGKDRIVYAGPTLSHYELVTRGVTRKSDLDWKKDLRAGRVPPRPVWTRGYLVK